MDTLIFGFFSQASSASQSATARTCYACKSWYQSAAWYISHTPYFYGRKTFVVIRILLHGCQISLILGFGNKSCRRLCVREADLKGQGICIKIILLPRTSCMICMPHSSLGHMCELYLVLWREPSEVSRFSFF
jgi:hypothetical protein